MIDDLASRTALTVAAFLLLATGFSVLDLHRVDAIREAAHGLAAHLSRQLDRIGSMDGDAVVRSDDSVLRVPPDLAGSTYRVEVRTTDVRVFAGPLVAVAALRGRVHPFEPDRDTYTPEEMSRRDAAVVVAGPGQPFLVERAAVWVHGERSYLTFVYLPR